MRSQSVDRRGKLRSGLIGGPTHEITHTNRTHTTSHHPTLKQTQLESYDDQNFLLTCTSSTNETTQYLLKIHNGVESLSPPIIDFQNSIMGHLNATPGVTTTQPFPCDSGDLSVTVPLPVLSKPDSPAPLTVRLLTYIQGTPMAYKTVTPSLLRTAGAYLANVDKSLDGYSHAASKRYHAWDARNTCDLRPFVKHINTAARQQLVSSVIDAFESTVMPDDKEFRMGVLQSDFNDANIICGDKEDIRGVIDFGDSVYRQVALDIAPPDPTRHSSKRLYFAPTCYLKLQSRCLQPRSITRPFNYGAAVRGFTPSPRLHFKELEKTTD